MPKQKDLFAAFGSYAPVVQALVIGQIITLSPDGLITWRIGHLEHVANLFIGDPVTTRRDYADDLLIAATYTPDLWNALTQKEQ